MNGPLSPPDLLIATAAASAAARAAGYEATLRAIAACTLVDAGDLRRMVQAAVEDALDGRWPECWNCGTAVHDGPCVGEGGES